MSTQLSKPTIGLHWLSAVFFLATLICGLLLEILPEDFPVDMMDLHKSFGVLALVAALVRVVWRFYEGAISSEAILTG